MNGIIELCRENDRLKEKNSEANSFIMVVAEMLGMETDGVGWDGVAFSIDDFQDAIEVLKGK